MAEVISISDMEEVPCRRKKWRMCPRESSQGTKNEMLNHPKRRSQRTLGLLKIGDGHLPRKRIPVGSSFQAHVPNWTGPLIINKQCSDDKEGVDDLKWLGTHIWPAKGGSTETNERNIGTGRTGFCHCTFPGSVECIIIHVNSARFQLRSDLGSAFHDWGFDEMGEEVSKSWTSEEQANFDDIVRLNPLSEGKSFLEPASKSFTSKSKKDIVSYYFNVYVLKRMSNQTRVLSETIDSDDDEGSSKVCSLERYVYVPVPEVSYTISSQSRKISQADHLSLYSKKILGLGNTPPVVKQQIQKKRRICPRESSQSTENEMLNQPKRRSPRIIGMLKNGDCHLPRKRIPMGPSFHADVPDWTGSLSINKRCSDDKEEEENPLKMGSEEGYGEQKEDGDPNFWWDDKNEVFTFRYNKHESYIPRQTVSEVPSAIVQSLFSDVDRKMLESYTDEDLIRLQNQMCFGSSIVAKYIYDVAQSRQCSLEVKERDNKKFRRNNDRLLKLNCERDNALHMLKIKKNKARELELTIKASGERIKQLEETVESSALRMKKFEEQLAVSGVETDKLRAEKMKKNEEARELELAIKASGERIKQLEAIVEPSARRTERLEKQLAVFRAETDKLRAENKLLRKQITPAPKLTREYMDAMYESRRQGFDFFKSAFLRRSFDSVAQVKKSVEELTYEEVCEEECALEGV